MKAALGKSRGGLFDLRGKERMPYKDAKRRVAYLVAYRAAHKDELVAYKHTYYLTHKEERSAYDAAYRESHRDEQRAYSVAYRKEHPEEKAASNAAYNATHSEEKRAYGTTYWEKHRDEKTDYNTAYNMAHREGLAAYDAAYRATHQSEIATRNAAYRKEHPQKMAEASRRRRALRQGAIIGTIDLEAIKARDQMRCAICGNKVAAKHFSLDHTIPLSLGGPHSQENVRVAHRRCNSRRGAGRLPVQMVLY